MIRYIPFILLLTALNCGCARLNIGRSMGVANRVVVRAERDATKARKKHERAIALLRDCNVCGAEELVRQALLCDQDFGPAHNTLGKIYFEQGKYYLAAWEFETARNLMPDRSEPLNNLGLVYEQVDRPDRAIEYYQLAMEQIPDSGEYLGNYLRARLRNDEKSSDLVPLLERLIEIDNRAEWRDWAKETLLMGDLEQPVVVESLELGPGEILMEEQLLPPETKGYFKNN